MEIYCLKCKRKTNSVNIKHEITKNGRNMIKSFCQNCNTKKCMFVANKSGGDMVGFLQKHLNPPEMHLPGYNYCGPFTKLEKRVLRGDPGINRVDEACKSHDIKYNRNKDNTPARHTADREFLEELDKIEDPTFGERVSRAVVKPIIKAKLKFGLGNKIY